MDVIVWFEYEWSRKGANDWFSSHMTADTAEGLKSKYELGGRVGQPEYEYRIVKKVLTTEVVEQ